jgi:GTP1/Obg family GTP-binding protein
MTDVFTIDQFLTILLEKGTTGAIALGVIYILIRKILEQYDKRIERCEAENEICRQDRTELHGRIESVQRERIHDLLETLKERDRTTR